MSYQEEFTGGSSYITGGEHDGDYSADYVDTDAQGGEYYDGGRGKIFDRMYTASGCMKGMYEWGIGVMVVILIVIPLVFYGITTQVDDHSVLPKFMKGYWGLFSVNTGTSRMTKRDKLSVTVTEEKEKENLTFKVDDKMRSNFLSDGQYSTSQSPTDADIRARVEVHGKVNNVVRDPAVQKVVSGYSDFNSANTPGTSLPNKRRKGMNTNDAGGNRFAGSETHANQEGSLWQKPVEQGSFVERMSAGSHNNWSGKFSESHLDPNRVYVENNEVGQPMYSWGLSPARGPRGKTDLLLGAAAAGF
jgi:hypothetical protein